MYDMSKTANLALRIQPDVKWALETAAKADGRSVSNYVERVLTEHLVSAGYMQSERDEAGADNFAEKRLGA